MRGGGQESKGVPAIRVVEKGAHQGDPEDEEAGVTGKEGDLETLHDGPGRVQRSGQLSTGADKGGPMVPWPGTGRCQHPNLSTYLKQRFGSSLLGTLDAKNQWFVTVEGTLVPTAQIPQNAAHTPGPGRPRRHSHDVSHVCHC